MVGRAAAGIATKAGLGGETLGEGVVAAHTREAGTAGLGSSLSLFTLHEATYSFKWPLEWAEGMHQGGKNR